MRVERILQIDNAVTRTSAADATTFWTDVAAQFASYTNVLYEPFNEPIDTSASWATFKPIVQGWIDTIRSKAPSNIIIVPSMSWCQRPGDVTASAPTGTNLMYTAHIYPGNWNTAFQSQVASAVARAPIFVTEWGYIINSLMVAGSNQPGGTGDGSMALEIDSAGKVLQEMRTMANFGYIQKRATLCGPPPRRWPATVRGVS